MSVATFADGCRIEVACSDAYDGGNALLGANPPSS